MSATIPPEPRPERLLVGVLASQGDFAAHVGDAGGLGAEAVEVRTAGQLADLDALVIPGGESTTISKAIERDGLDAGDPRLTRRRGGRSSAPARG